MKIKIIFNLIIITIISVGMFLGYGWYNEAFIATTKPNNDAESYKITVEQGQNLANIGSKLSQEGVINFDLSLFLLSKTKPEWVLRPGVYKIDIPSSPSQILDQLKDQSQEIAILAANSSKRQSTIVTIKEGFGVGEVITAMQNAGMKNHDKIAKFAQNPDNFNDFGYEFLPNPLSCIYGNRDCAKYYIEGYLYPDTYEFFVDESPNLIFQKLLDNFDTKVWQQIDKSKFAKDDLQKIITMASVIERETGRPIEGVNSSNRDELMQEKRIMAGVFFNRLANDQKWQSDPTGTYGTGKSFCQQTLVSQTDCLYLDSPEVDNLYNTYKIVGYPIGPISSPQLSSIEAVIDPIDNDYIFFVSDASGKKYFAKTNQDHVKNIEIANQINETYR